VIELQLADVSAVVFVNCHHLIFSLFGWLVADGWCWFVLREEYCWLVVGGWFVVREKYCRLVADKPSEHGAYLSVETALQTIATPKSENPPARKVPAATTRARSKRAAVHMESG
jgi:hypothetical protein